MRLPLILSILFYLFFQVYAQDVPNFPRINYNIVIFKKWGDLKNFLKDFEKKKNYTKYRVLTTLNRKELRYFKIKEPIIVPDTFLTDLRAYSVFPMFYNGASNLPKIVIVSNLYQAYGCYEYGKLVRFSAVNTGKRSSPTYPGKYYVQWKERLRRSSFNENWIMPYTVNFHRLAGLAFHQFSMPGYPASHMCIRQFYEDAQWLFNWCEIPKKDSSGKLNPKSGTPVIVLDFYNFGIGKKKWLELASNKDTLDYLPSNPIEVEEALIPIIHIPQELYPLLSRKERKRYETAYDTLVSRGVIPPNLKLTPSNPLKKKTISP